MLNRYFTGKWRSEDYKRTAGQEQKNKVNDDSPKTCSLFMTRNNFFYAAYKEFDNL
jgi:hypothetical protein